MVFFDDNLIFANYDNFEIILCRSFVVLLFR